MIRVVDLFSGAGGLTLGFKAAIENNAFITSDDYDILFANDMNKDATDAFALNFPDIPMLNCSITKLTKEYLEGEGIDYLNVDVVIGGPPCQSYSTVGKRQYDERALMYREYRRLLSFIQPKMFLFENVKGLLSMKNDNGLPVLEDIKKDFSDFSEFEIDLSYEIKEKVLNAKDFGIPQNRERIFLIGIRKDLNVACDWKFPVPDLTMEENFLTLEDAIGDLPALINGETKSSYERESYRAYQILMRGDNKELTCHVNGHNGKRMLKIMGAVIPGEGRDYINELVKAGQLDKECYLTSGYTNTYGKLWWDKPCSTITNNLSAPSSLRCIHPLQNRALTPREGARIQSFPDSFQFSGGKGSVCSQVGNAVPPLLAMAFAKEIKSFLDKLE